ncbi:MAG: rRNA maturation RNase YbeY [bacterium]|nr:rRNA maturation RNase YbeY [bacterium]
MAITFQKQDIDFKIRAISKKSLWVKKIIELEGKTTGQINFVFMDDASLLKKNIQFMEHTTFTDIITFDYCEKLKVSGDILISIERVEENAEKFGVEFETELLRVMIHGILHLCGYGDKSKAARDLMRKKEDLALKRY